MVESKSGSISNNINTYSEFQRESAARDIKYVAAGPERRALSARPILLSYNCPVRNDGPSPGACLTRAQPAPIWRLSKKSAFQGWLVSVIRTVGRATSQPDVRAIPTRARRSCSPTSPFGMIGLTLSSLVPGLRILGPIIQPDTFAELVPAHDGTKPVNFERTPSKMPPDQLAPPR